MRASWLHVPALLRPWAVRCCMAQVLERECAAEAAAGQLENSQPLQISATTHAAMLATITVSVLAKLSTMLLFSCVADHCWWRTSIASCA